MSTDAKNRKRKVLLNDDAVKRGGSLLGRSRVAAATPDSADFSWPNTEETPTTTTTNRNEWKEKLNISPPQKRVPDFRGQKNVKVKKTDASFSDVEQKIKEDGWEVA